MSKLNESSDEDSFHSASDGEQDTHSSVSTQNSNSQVTSKDDSSEEYVKLSKCKEEVPVQEILKPKDFIDFKKPMLPTKKVSVHANNKEDSEDDDWFKTQMEEVSRKSSSEIPSTLNRQYSNEEKLEQKDDESKVSSIWDWTAIHGVGISNVVETGLGLPNPEAMAKLSKAERRKLLEEAQNIKEPEPSLSSDEGLGGPENRKSFSHLHSESGSNINHGHSSSSKGLFPGSGLFSGLVSGSLDVLESLGKKTFETLTGDKEKRRFFLKQENSGQDLSDLLRELRETPNETGSIESNVSSNTMLGYGSTVIEKFNTNFVSLFEKSSGMVHLEGLEGLSKDQDKRTKAYKTDYNFNEHLLEFCVEDVSEVSTEDFEYELSKYVHFKSLPLKLENVLEVNSTLTQELTLRQAAVDAEEEIVVEAIYEAAITSLAKLTAHSIQTLHKMAQLIIITHELPEIESLFAFTYLLCRRLSFFASQYANILSLVESSSKVDEVVTNIFFECSNACHYVKKALELLRPFFKKAP